MVDTAENSVSIKHALNQPLYEESNNVLVLQKCIIPELHVMSGIVNHPFWNGIIPLVGREKAL